MTESNFTSYALLGSGRVASHFQHYLAALNLPVKYWSRASGEDLSSAVEGCSHVLFAVSDRAINEVAARIPGGKTLVHFSGAARIDGVHAAHPLMTFGTQLESLSWYERIPFVLDTGTRLADLLPGLKNPSFALAPELRPLYHALASLAGNSTYLLWRDIGDEFEKKLGLPRDLLAPFLHQVVDSATSIEPGGLTGPVARKDWPTVAQHLHALEPTKLARSYQDFLNLAGRSGHHIPEDML